MKLTPQEIERVELAREATLGMLETDTTYVPGANTMAFLLSLIDRLAQEPEPQTCATCRWCRESDKTNRLFCFVNGPESEFETFKDEYCSGYERKEATHGTD